MLRQLFELFGDEDAQERITKAKADVEARLNTDALSETEIESFLAEIKQRYTLETLEITYQSEDRARIFGKINPEFELISEVIRDDTEMVPEDEQEQLETFFRAMSIDELEDVRKLKQLSIQMRSNGEPMGMNFVTLNSSVYNEKLMSDPKHLREDGKHKYEYLVQITVLPGTVEMLEDPKHARIEKDNEATERAYKGRRIRERGKGERGIVVLKREPLTHSTGKNVARSANYGITPASTTDPDDPMQLFNARIVKLEVIKQVTH